MIEESTVYVHPTAESFAFKKQKSLKVHIPGSKLITKPKMALQPVHPPLRPRAQPQPKNPKNLEKIRKQLKYEQIPKEEAIQEETTEDDEEVKVEDQGTQQPVANGIEEEAIERREGQNSNSWDEGIKINGNYAEQLLAKFGKIQITFSPQNFLQNHKITSSMRSKMIDWKIEVLTSYKCLDETFFLAVSIMDRYLAKADSPQDASELHLIGVTTIFIACKYEEIYPLRLQTVHERIAHKKLAAEQIKAKELEILEALDFNVTGPTVFDYLILLIHLINIKSQLSPEKFLVFEKIVSYMAKLVVFEYDIISNKTISTIAAGVLYVSFKILEQIEPGFVLFDNMQKVKVLLNLDDTALIEVATQILWLARNFDKIFQNLTNLKKFNTDLFDQLQRFQSKKTEENCGK